jgi:hypothetical protein
VTIARIVALSDGGVVERTTAPRDLEVVVNVLGIAGGVEAATGFEPVIRDLQSRALPLGYAAPM